MAVDCSNPTMGPDRVNRSDFMQPPEKTPRFRMRISSLQDQQQGDERASRHVLTHKVPFLWRFHQVHHVDLDLDASTALRFHALEMALSVPWRAAQVLVFGVSTKGLALWQTLTLMEILFHHSNIRLPAGLERRLCRIIVTPRMHGIHHSIVQEETDSNWSTIFSWPDYVHGTLKLNVPQDEITIGVPAYQDPKELTFGKLMKMPFTANRPSWKLVGNGKPDRTELLSLPRTTLAS